MKQLMKEEAIRFAESKIWESWTYHQKAEFQLFQKKLCMPFSVFHEAVEKSLGRPVYTHEFAWSDDLKAEFLGEKEPPTFEQIVGLIPEEKRMIIFSS